MKERKRIYCLWAGNWQKSASAPLAWTLLGWGGEDYGLALFKGCRKVRGELLATKNLSCPYWRSHGHGMGNCPGNTESFWWPTYKEGGLGECGAGWVLCGGVLKSCRHADEMRTFQPSGAFPGFSQPLTRVQNYHTVCMLNAPGWLVTRWVAPFPTRCVTPGAFPRNLSI